MCRFAAILLSLAGVTLTAPPSKTLLATGSEAPEFALPTQTGVTVRLSDYRGKSAVVLVFYPGDATPVCTKQLCAIRDDYSGFKNRNAAVFGVNPGSAESHADFANAHKFPFPLLVDRDKSMIKAYGCDAFFMIQRTVYVISSDGRIVYAKRGNPPVSEILAALP